MYKHAAVVFLILCSQISFLFAQKVTFTPRWTPQAQFAGFYVAKELGFYKDIGLDVEFKHPSAAVNAVELLKRGETDLIGCSLSDGIALRTTGFNIQCIMQIFQRSALLVVADRPLNNQLESLEGLRVGKWKAGHSVVAISALKDKGVNVDWISFMTGTNLFLSGAIDATLAMTYNELIAMRSTGRKIEENQIIRFADIGYNIIEDGVYAKEDYINNNLETIRKFRKATEEGWMWAQENPDKALDIVMRMVEKHKIPTNRAHQKAMLKEVLSLEYKPECSTISFDVSRKDFDAAVDMLRKNGDIKDEVVYDSFIIKPY